MDAPPTNGACKGHPTSLFFPDKERMNRSGGNRQAIAICKTCPKIDACLQYALVWEQYGVWGGTTETQRQKLRKELGITVKKHSYLLPVTKPVDVAMEEEQYDYYDLGENDRI